MHYLNVFKSTISTACKLYSRTKIACHNFLKVNVEKIATTAAWVCFTKG